ncbi:zinc-binding dehydrogenase [Ensifer sp. 4252]|uniref:zinc-binding dehydrogenase n=1 Tax=Ensifer sp. 4252 TaxID=3373915 RepID=UPI003D1DE0C9
MAGCGVDLVVDPVGATLQSSRAALRPEGRLVFVGNAGGSQLSIDLWLALQANQSLFGVFMGTQLEKPDVYGTVSRMLDWAAAGGPRTFQRAQAANSGGSAGLSPLIVSR